MHKFNLINVLQQDEVIDKSMDIQQHNKIIDNNKIKSTYGMEKCKHKEEEETMDDIFICKFA